MGTNTAMFERAAISQPSPDVPVGYVEAHFLEAMNNNPFPGSVPIYASPQPTEPTQPATQEAMDAEHWAELHRLREAVRGPDGYATWQDAATAERIRRVKAERELAATQQPQPAEQGEDAARLDWLEKTGREFSWGEDYVRWIVTGTPARSLRANIDAARAAQDQKK